MRYIYILVLFGLTSCAANLEKPKALGVVRLVEDWNLLTKQAMLARYGRQIVEVDSAHCPPRGDSPGAGSFWGNVFGMVIQREALFKNCIISTDWGSTKELYIHENSYLLDHGGFLTSATIFISVGNECKGCIMKVGNGKFDCCSEKWKEDCEDKKHEIQGFFKDSHSKENLGFVVQCYPYGLSIYTKIGFETNGYPKIEILDCYMTKGN
jgi:hypothetical protein